MCRAPHTLSLYITHRNLRRLLIDKLGTPPLFSALHKNTRIRLINVSARTNNPSLTSTPFIMCILPVIGELSIFEDEPPALVALQIIGPFEKPTLHHGLSSMAGGGGGGRRWLRNGRTVTHYYCFILLRYTLISSSFFCYLCDVTVKLSYVRYK